MGCQQCLPPSVVQLKGKHCRKPHCRNGVVGTFGLGFKESTFQYSKWLSNFVFLFTRPTLLEVKHYWELSTNFLLSDQYNADTKQNMIFFQFSQ
jgi:hypothetical protein